MSEWFNEPSPDYPTGEDENRAVEVVLASGEICEGVLVMQEDIDDDYWPCFDVVFTDGSSVNFNNCQRWRFKPNP